MQRRQFIPTLAAGLAAAVAESSELTPNETANESLAEMLRVEGTIVSITHRSEGIEVWVNGPSQGPSACDCTHAKKLLPHNSDTQQILETLAEVAAEVFDNGGLENLHKGKYDAS